MIEFARLWELSSPYLAHLTERGSRQGSRRLWARQRSKQLLLKPCSLGRSLWFYVQSMVTDVSSQWGSQSYLGQRVGSIGYSSCCVSLVFVVLVSTGVDISRWRVKLLLAEYDLELASLGPSWMSSVIGFRLLLKLERFKNSLTVGRERKRREDGDRCEQGCSFDCCLQWLSY